MRLIYPHSFCKSTFLIALFSLFRCSSCFVRNAIYPSCKTRSRNCDAHRMVKIALTREEGGNDKLAKLLDGYDVCEIPCIMFAGGEDSTKLPDAIKTHDLIVITSPQAAKVFLDSWEIAGKPDNLKIATVGEGSSKPLKARGLKPLFEPSDSTAVTLAAELPSDLGKTVLYPSSAIAENTLVEGLEKRGFQVTRLNTYSTVPAIWSAEQEAFARSMDIVTFASPSAVKIWSEKVGTAYTAVVIGPSSAKAANSAGFERVVSPEGSKGLGAWAETIKEAVLVLQSAALQVNRDQ